MDKDEFCGGSVRSAAQCALAADGVICESLASLYQVTCNSCANEPNCQWCPRTNTCTNVTAPIDQCRGGLPSVEACDAYEQFKRQDQLYKELTGTEMAGPVLDLTSTAVLEEPMGAEAIDSNPTDDAMPLWLIIVLAAIGVCFLLAVVLAVALWMRARRSAKTAERLRLVSILAVVLFVLGLTPRRAVGADERFDNGVCAADDFASKHVRTSAASATRRQHGVVSAAHNTAHVYDGEPRSAAVAASKCLQSRLAVAAVTDADHNAAAACFGGVDRATAVAATARRCCVLCRTCARVVQVCRHTADRSVV